MIHMPRTSHKTVILAPFLAVFACALCACPAMAHEPIPTINLMENPLPVRESASENADNPPVDPAGFAMAQSKSSKDGKKKPADSSAGKDSKAPPKDAPAAQPSSEWVLVLGTFTEDAHDQAARTMLDNLRQIAPEVARGSRVH